MAIPRSLVHACLGFALLTPLVATPDHFVFGFVVPRVLFLRAIVEVMLGAWVLLALHSVEYRDVRRTPVTLCGAVFLLSAGLSSLLGVDLHRSLWDTYERMLGLVTLLHYAALYVVATAVLKSWAEWRRMFHLILVVGVLVAGVAIAQKLDPFVFGNQGNPRVSSTLGHPSYLGAHGVFTAAVGALLLPRERHWLARLWVVVGGLSGATCVLLCETRGTLLGLAAGLFVAIAGYSIALPRGRSRLAARVVLFLALAGGLAALPLLGLERKILELEHELARDRAGLFLRWHAEGPDSELEATLVLEELRSRDDAALAPILAQLDGFREREGSGLAALTPHDLRGLDAALLTEENRLRPVRTDDRLERSLARSRRAYSVAYRIPGLRRFARATVTKKTATTRILLWESALAAARDHPVTGWGPSNFHYAHNLHYPPALLEHGFPETWADNAHNVFLNTLAVQGGVGLLAYVLLVTAPVLVLWKGYRRGAVDAHVAVVGIAFFAAHAVHNVFVFENASSWLDFTLMLAFVNRSASPVGPAARDDREPPWVYAGIVIGVTAFALLVLAVRPARACLALDRALAHMLQGDPGASVQELDRYLRLNPPHSDEGKKLFAIHAGRLGDELVEARGGVRGEAGLDELGRLVAEFVPVGRRAFEELGGVLSRTELDVRAALLRARLADQLLVLGGDREPLERADPDLSRALLHSPGRQELLFARARVWMRLQRPREDVIALLQAAIEAAPTVSTSWISLADAHVRTRHPDEARRVLEEARGRGVRFRDAEMEFVESVLGDTEQ
jgi:O-antigen ligase